MKKRVGIIYRLWKERKLPKVTEQNIKNMYNLVNEIMYGHSYNIDTIKEINLNKAIENAFAGEYNKVEEKIMFF